MKPERTEHDCVGRFNALIDQGKTGRTTSDQTAEPSGACPGCGEQIEPAIRLGRALSELADEIDRIASDTPALITDDESARMLVRLAKLEAWHRLSRRACAASVALAACLTVIIGASLGFDLPDADQDKGARPTQPQMAAQPDEAPSQPDKPGHASEDRATTQGLGGQELAFALPLSGWIDLPPENASADLSVWWLVLNYGRIK